jgi:SseB protein C-terminal domain
MPDVVRRQESVIHFVGCQDGRPERDLKSGLCLLFAKELAVQRAYLVRVRYGDENVVNVALALVAAPASQELVDAVQKVFHSMFGIGQYLDIFFASPTQEAEISTECRPFFGASALANVV